MKSSEILNRSLATFLVLLTLQSSSQALTSTTITTSLVTLKDQTQNIAALEEPVIFFRSQITEHSTNYRLRREVSGGLRLSSNPTFRVTLKRSIKVFKTKLLAPIGLLVAGLTTAQPVLPAHFTFLGPPNVFHVEEDFPALRGMPPIQTFTSTELNVTLPKALCAAKLYANSLDENDPLNQLLSSKSEVRVLFMKGDPLAFAKKYLGMKLAKERKSSEPEIKPPLLAMHFFSTFTENGKLTSAFVVVDPKALQGDFLEPALHELSHIVAGLDRDSHSELQAFHRSLKGFLWLTANRTRRDLAQLLSPEDFARIDTQIIPHELAELKVFGGELTTEEEQLLHLPSGTSQGSPVSKVEPSRLPSSIGTMVETFGALRSSHPELDSGATNPRVDFMNDKLALDQFVSQVRLDEGVTLEVPLSIPKAGSSVFSVFASELSGAASKLISQQSTAASDLQHIGIVMGKPSAFAESLGLTVEKETKGLAIRIMRGGKEGPRVLLLVIDPLSAENRRLLTTTLMTTFAAGIAGNVSDAKPFLEWLSNSYFKNKPEYFVADIKTPLALTRELSSVQVLTPAIVCSSIALAVRSELDRVLNPGKILNLASSGIVGTFHPFKGALVSRSPLFYSHAPSPYRSNLLSAS